MTENKIIETASIVGAHCNDDGRWTFEDDEHLVEFALELIHADREVRDALIKSMISDLLDDTA